MELRKTIRCKIHSLTNTKERILGREYEEYQKLCKEVKAAVDWDFLPDQPFSLFKDGNRHAGTVWGAIRTVSKLRPFCEMREQPLYLRNDCFEVVENANTVSLHWLRMPTKQRRGGVWLPIIVPEKYISLLAEKLCDSKITRGRRGNWYVNITIKREVEDLVISKNPTIVLAVDLGERNIATSVSVAPEGTVKSVRFYGRGVRGIRRHYSWLRKRLGNRKLQWMIEKLGGTEGRRANDVLHKISRAIVDEAKRLDAVILLGDLKGIRDSAKEKGKRFNRIVSNMPCHKLSTQITYKAQWDGVPIIVRSERGTSSICYRCGAEGKRPTQPRFRCNACGLDYFNADANGGINQGRGLLAIWEETGPTGLAHNSGGGSR